MIAIQDLTKYDVDNIFGRICLAIRYILRIDVDKNCFHEEKKRIKRNLAKYQRECL